MANPDLPADACPDCRGSGLYLHADDWGPDVACGRCLGTGRVAHAPDGPGPTD